MSSKQGPKDPREDKVWMFKLDNGETVYFDSDKSPVEVAVLLQSMEAGGYIHDTERVVPVRRIVFAERTDNRAYNLHTGEWREIFPRGGK